MLAGGQCVPVKLPSLQRMVWHKFYSSMQRKGDPAKAEKDLIQAVTLAALLVEQDSANLSESYRAAPGALREATRTRFPRIQALLRQHPQVQEAFSDLR
jgi:hypothetical protein